MIFTKLLLSGLLSGTGTPTCGGRYHYAKGLLFLFMDPVS